MCERAGCTRPLLARGLCGTHYERWRHGRAMDAPIRLGGPRLSPERLRPCAGGCGAEVMARTSHRKLCDDCRVIARRATRKRHRERQKARDDYERPYLREQHGITEADYQRMLDEQGGRCAGCNREPPIAGRDLHIDHDHDCCPKGGRSCDRCRRGLLCAECNMALGLLAEDPTRLENLAAYVRQWKGVMGVGHAR